VREERARREAVKQLDLLTLCIAVDDLFARRVKALEGIDLKAAAIYLPLLRERREGLEGWMRDTPADLDPKPLRARLKETVERHRELADSIDDQLVALRSARGLSDEVRAKLAKVRDGVLPRRLDRRMSARARVRITKRIRSAAEARRDALVALPALGGGTMADCVADLVALAEEMDALQSRIGDCRAPRDVKASVAARRTDLLGLVGRFRACVADETSARPELAHLDHALFAYFDELAAGAPRQRASEKGVEEPAPPAAADA
jgi:hypothetical protein